MDEGLSHAAHKLFLTGAGDGRLKGPLRRGNVAEPPCDHTLTTMTGGIILEEVRRKIGAEIGA